MLRKLGFLDIDDDRKRQKDFGDELEAFRIAVNFGAFWAGSL